MLNSQGCCEDQMKFLCNAALYAEKYYTNVIFI